MPKRRRPWADDELLAKFQQEYIDYNRISYHTSRQWLRELRILAEYTELPLVDVRADDVRRLCTHMLANGAHINSVDKRLRRMKTFYAWAYDAEVIDSDQMLRITRIKPPRGAGKYVPRPYTRQQLLVMWDTLEKRWPLVWDPKRENRMLDRLANGRSRFHWEYRQQGTRRQLETILMLALHGGLRAGEIRFISPDSLHRDNTGVIVYSRKGDGSTHHRNVPFTAELRTVCDNWLNFRSALVAAADIPRTQCWCRMTGQSRWWLPYDDTRWDDLLPSKLGPTAPDGRSWSMHRLRHTAGTEWLRATKRIEVVQKLLGHSSITTTMGYAAIANIDVTDALAQAEAEFSLAARGLPAPTIKRKLREREQAEAEAEQA